MQMVICISLTIVTELGDVIIKAKDSGSFVGNCQLYFGMGLEITSSEHNLIKDLHKSQKKCFNEFHFTNFVLE